MTLSKIMGSCDHTVCIFSSTSEVIGNLLPCAWWLDRIVPQAIEPERWAAKRQRGASLSLYTAAILTGRLRVLSVRFPNLASYCLTAGSLNVWLLSRDTAAMLPLAAPQIHCQLELALLLQLRHNIIANSLAMDARKGSSTQVEPAMSK